MRGPAALVALSFCVAGPTSCGRAIGQAIFATPFDHAVAVSDARFDGAGGAVPPPTPSPDATTPPLVAGPENVRFPKTAPESVTLLAGRGRLDDYLVLGTVVAGDSGGVGTQPGHTAYGLRQAAALLGAEAVLDVRVAGKNRLEGLAVRKRAPSP